MKEDCSRPLDGLLVIDFSQFLSGPSAGLRLADLGARVIKIENPNGGDLCRRLYISNLQLDGDSTLFHSINRNKESFSIDMKDEAGRHLVKQLLEKADVVIQNFRPAVSKRLGLDYASVQAINPRIIYGSISGYGDEGPLVGKPGQDLLVQSITGLPGLNQSAYSSGPVPFGLAICDMIAGAHLVQGILACLIRRGITGKGGQVEISLLESTLDAMMNETTAYMNGYPDARLGSVDSGAAPIESRNASGIYAAADGYLAVDGVSAGQLLSLLGSLADTQPEASAPVQSSSSLADQLKVLFASQPKAVWLKLFTDLGILCEEVLTWDQLVQHEAFQRLGMTQEVSRSNGVSMQTLRCPISIDGSRFYSKKGSPKIGEHNEQIIQQFDLTMEDFKHP